MIRRALTVLAVLGATLLSAQEAKTRLTLTDAILRGWQYYPERMTGLQWIPDTDTYSYVKDNTLRRGGVDKRGDADLATLADLNAALAGKDTLRAFPAVDWADTRNFTFSAGPRTYSFNLTQKTATLRYALPPDAGDDDPDPAHGKVAYTVDNNLYIAWPGDSSTQVTFDGTDGIVNGKSVHRDEYGIYKGTFWSPDGSKLAFYRMDETMVTPYYVEDITTTPSTFKKFRYPMAGQTSHHVTLGVYDTRTGKTVFIDPEGPKDHYLTNISWEPDNAHINIILLNRATDHFRVVRFDAASGKAVRTLFEERNDKWLEPEHPLTFLKKTPTRYIHWSQRDGWWHLYLYDIKLGLVRQLTQGNWVVNDILGTDPNERFLYVKGTAEIDPKDPKGAMESHLYRVDLSTGKTVRLTQEPGTHHGDLSASGRYLIHRWGSIQVPGRTEIIDTQTGRVFKTLLVSDDPLRNVVHGSVELVQVPGENGAILNGRIIKPSHFDPSRKYPVLVYTYNGPHVQLVANSFLGGAQLWMLEAAERGYIVFTLDGHGSSNRGLAFEQAIHRQLGITEVKDQLHGADYLKGLPYVDASRMAVHGWSFGGYMTTALMLRSPGTFQVGVAGGAVQDWHLYEVMYTERYMDTPEENPEGYAASMLPPLADQLKGDLLLIHDNMDQTVVPQHAERFLKSCVDKGVYPDFFYYPGHEHNVRGKDRVHLYTQILDYIDAKLGVKP
ncbi:MAG TPA: DPP IV N-terminal domain-containing protein [Flavobacteriales bacterium]|nr:DPP IV N-terminal domain-containing protein [Flavobacteriales bacterium]